jgi:hypothetical protein
LKLLLARLVAVHFICNGEKRARRWTLNFYDLAQAVTFMSCTHVPLMWNRQYLILK